MIDQYITRYGKRLYGLCLSLCANVHEAEDLYQDTWLKVMQSFAQYDREKPFEPWLTQICVNLYRMADFVLFENPAGEVQITELRYNYFLARYRIKESSTITVTDPVQFTAEFPFFVGHNNVIVNDLTSFDISTQYEGFQIQENHVFDAFVGVGIFMTLAESFVVLIIDKLRKRTHPTGKEN